MTRKAIGWIIAAVLVTLFAAAEIHKHGFFVFVIFLLLALIFTALIYVAVWLITGGK